MGVAILRPPNLKINYLCYECKNEYYGFTGRYQMDTE